jgi:hypothetical protein
MFGHILHTDWVHRGEDSEDGCFEARCMHLAALLYRERERSRALACDVERLTALLRHTESERTLLEHGFASLESVVASTEATQPRLCSTLDAFRQRACALERENSVLDKWVEYLRTGLHQQYSAKLTEAQQRHEAELAWVLHELTELESVVFSAHESQYKLSVTVAAKLDALLASARTAHAQKRTLRSCVELLRSQNAVLTGRLQGAQAITDARRLADWLDMIDDPVPE